MNEEEKKELAPQIYLHVNNGGISFYVQDRGFGPSLIIKQGHFGAINTEMEILTNKESLKLLGEMLMEASERDFSDEYCCSATYENTGRRITDAKELENIELKEADSIPKGWAAGIDLDE